MLALDLIMAILFIYIKKNYKILNSQKKQCKVIEATALITYSASISFKTAILTCKILNSREPDYLRNSLSFYVPVCTWPSMNSCFLALRFTLQLDLKL